MTWGDLNKAIPVWTPTRAKEVLREFIKQLDEKEAFVVEKEGMKFANGAIGCGEITAIPTAPAIALAYYRKDGEFQTELPLKNTPYAKV